MDKILILFLCLLPSMAFAWGDSIDPTRPFLPTDARGMQIQGSATDPLATALISSDVSNQSALFPSILWFRMTYYGSGTCKISVSNTTSKPSWSIPLSTSTSNTYSTVSHKNALYLNYSGCNTGVIEKMGIN